MVTKEIYIQSIMRIPRLGTYSTLGKGDQKEIPTVTHELVINNVYQLIIQVEWTTFTKAWRHKVMWWGQAGSDYGQ